MFERKVAVAAFAAAAALAVVPAAAPAQTHGSQIKIANCSILRWQESSINPYWRPWAWPNYNQGIPITDGLEIDYTNVGTQTAVRVAFEVNYRGEREHIVDVGTFSPGAQIKHTFGNFSGFAYQGPTPNSCRVRAVRYADGSVWHAQSQPLQPSPAR